ncbi:MAG TPA: PAS domain S-box protein [Puia sp.]|nr:PAS domain S-box protein [Puia sp.]
MHEHFEERQSMLAAIIDSSEDAIISKDLNSIIMSWNKSAERMFGYTEEEVKGKNINILIPRERWEEEDLIIAQLRAGKRVENFETIRVAKSGRRLHISLTISPIKNASGTVIGASKIARDITRQKENEEKIRQYTRRLELINSAGTAISTRLNVSDILQKVTDITTVLSGAAFGAFFYNQINNKGNTYRLVTVSGVPGEAFDKRELPRETEVFLEAFSGKSILRSDDITKDPRYGKNVPYHGMRDGHLPVISYLAVPIKSPGGVVVGGLFFGHSEPGKFTKEHELLVSAIASQAAVALDNAKLYEEIQVINAKKDEFIAFASHELKTPLTTLNGYIQLARMNPGKPLENLDKMDRQVDRITGIISDLLDVSKIQANKFDLNFKKISFNSLLCESLESIEWKGREIVINTLAKDIFVEVDGPKIIQVITNLLTNAVKYSNPATSIDVSADVIGEFVRISISDQGIGIPDKELTQIFNQYYQLKKSRAKKEGLGLGLFISKEIVEGHAGKIWAESQEGRGSTFHVELPIERILHQA